MSVSFKNLFIKVCPKSLMPVATDVLRKVRLVGNGIEGILFPWKMKGYCPCCGRRVKSFVPGIFRDHPEMFNSDRYANTEQNVLCPVCRALPRHRILALWCNGHKDYLKSANILYFAPEYSMMRWMKRHKVSCTTADLYKDADLKLDIQATGLPDESYDMIICNHVLEHVDDFRTALKELYRILRRGGNLICSFPMDPTVELLEEDPDVLTDKERLQRFGQTDHKRVFGMKSDQFLREAGFRVKKIKGERCPEEILPIVGPADYDMNILFLCKKG